MTTAPLEKTMPIAKAGFSHTTAYWLVFCVVMAILIAAPLKIVNGTGSPLRVLALVARR